MAVAVSRVVLELIQAVDHEAKASVAWNRHLDEILKPFLQLGGESKVGLVDVWFKGGSVKYLARCRKDISNQTWTVCKD